MEQIFALMIFVGGFAFITGGLCFANSKEAKESELVSNILIGISLNGLASIVVGIIGSIWIAI